MCACRENLALVYIFVKDTYYRSFTKGELVGFTDFLCNFYSSLV